MTDEARRVDLPSGGWWELTARPLWRHVRPWIGDESRGSLISRALVSLTRDWSFQEAVSETALLARDDEDIAAVLEVLNREVLPSKCSGGSDEDAEALFAGLVSGRVPAEYVEVCLMAATGWTWQALSETPAEVVSRMALFLAVKGARDAGGVLDLT